MVRELKKRRYVAVFLLTCLVFSLGLLIGLLLERSSVTMIKDLSEKQGLDYASMQLQYSYLMTLEKGEACSALHTALQRNLVELDNSLKQITDLKESTQFDKK